MSAPHKQQPPILKPRDTIAALATPAGRGGVGIIRVSGVGLAGMAKAITGRSLLARQATLTPFLDADAQPIDEGIALYFPAPASFTGEDVLELQGHGGPVVMSMLLARCVALGARMAAPGEFSQRAFLNGKLDLAQAEGIADLIDASSQAAARSALRSLQGQFSLEINTMLQQLIRLRMLLEATLDFPDEEIDVLQAADAQGQLLSLQQQLGKIQQAARQGSLLREGLQVVLVGQPNVGKSSLLNALAGHEAAIVSEVAGTTRDTVRELIQIDDIPLHIIDTAGLRTTPDVVERMGIDRTWAAVNKADLVMLLVDIREGMTAADEAILQQLPEGLARIMVFNKIDLVGAAAGCETEAMSSSVYLSARTGEGMDLLRQVLLQHAGWQGHSEGLFLARARHMQAMARAQICLDAAQLQFSELELLAEELRLAQQALSEITGEFTPDDLLGEIFSRFCIGK